MTRLAIRLVIVGAILAGCGSPGPGAVTLNNELESVTGLGDNGPTDQVVTGINLATNTGDTPATVTSVELIGPAENPPPAEVRVVSLASGNATQVGVSNWPMSDQYPDAQAPLHDPVGYEISPGEEVEFLFVFDLGGSPRWEGMRLKYTQDGHEYSDRTYNVIVLCPGSTQEVADCMDQAAA